MSEPDPTTDPALKRAWDAWQLRVHGDHAVHAPVTDAAREALKPIRARHYPVELAHMLSGRHKTVCAHCHRRGFFTLESEHGDWPCPDAKDAYTTEELA